MANKNNKQNDKLIKDAVNLSKSFDQGFDQIYSYVGSVGNASELHGIDNQIDVIIRDEIQNTQSVTSDDMSTYLVKTFNEQDRSNVPINSIDEIFNSSDTNSIATFFQNRYQSRMMLYDDLDMICTQLAELQEAVLTTRDAIVTADDITSMISRSIRFEGVSDDSVDSYIATVKEIENRYKLPKKLKNNVITSTLKFGSFYVYSIPYAKLMEEQYARKLKDPSQYGVSIKESLCESALDIKNELAGLGAGYEKIPDSKFKSIVECYGSNISVVNEVSSIPLLDGVDVTKLFNSKDWEKTYKNNDNWKNVSKGFKTTDGVIDPYQQAKGKFDSVVGVYIKYIDPRKMIPIKILDTTLGYYYIHETPMVTAQSPFSQTIRVSNNTNQVISYDDNVESTFLSKITDKIVAAFDPKYVQDNAKFKDLIVNALKYTDIYKNRIEFQFIPAEYITEFTIDEDEDNEGQSILMKSLFYAKLYLALLIFKMITIITRSNDTRVYYIKNSGIDTNIVNQVQEVARSIKQKQISFLDLLNYNSIISNVGQYKDIFMPIGRSGERSIEFDTIAGQNVDLNSEFMEFLRTNMINNTGVPSVIMNYVNEADYAKTLQMANSKFASRVLNLQLDLNPSITELYRKILRFSASSIPEDVIDKLVITLNPPKILNTINSADNINTVDQLVQALLKVQIGETDNDDKSNYIRDIMYKILAKEYLPGFDWKTIEETYKIAEMEANKILLNKEDNNE